MNYFADVRALTRKDLLLELRARDTLPAMLLFVVAVFVVFHFSLPSSSSDLAANGLLWVAIVFTALLGLSRAFAAEREQGVIDGLVLAPSDRSAIWVAKSIATFAFLALAEIVALPVFALFFHGVDGTTIAAVVLADVGICAVGTFVGAMAVVTRAREILNGLETDELSRGGRPSLSGGGQRRQQLGLFQAPAIEDDPIRVRLRAVDVNHLTPMQALSLIAELRSQAE